VLELAHNGELHRYMNHIARPFTETEAASILKQVVEGLLYLHSHNIMHRDISLSNLLLSKEMHVKIADFGLATQLKRPDERHMTMCGTPNYISPEVVSRVSHGLPADVWSVGCMLYTLLVGRPPFETDAVQSTLNKVVMSEYLMPAHLSYEAQDLINKLLKKLPHERITLGAVLCHPFMLKRLDNSSNVGHSTPGALNVFSQSLESGDSGIITFASSKHSGNYGWGGVSPSLFILGDSRNSQRIRSVENSGAHQGLPQIEEEFMQDHHRLPYEQPGLFRQTSTGLADQNWPGTCKMPPIRMDMDMVPNCRPVLLKEERISVPPLSSKRLLPTRYKTKNAIMSILRNGEVVLEFIKFRPKLNEDRICDICRISDDGQRIIIYQPDPGR